MTGPAGDDELDAANRATYARDDVVSWYAGQSHLSDAEARVLESVTDLLTGGVVLDIGVGGGRTTGHLLPRVKEYVGIDYVPELVEAARRRHPGARLEVADARDLSRFEPDTFDVVLFSFQGIDGVSHEDRLLILGEVHRVLRPGGAFVFSAHNRDWDRFDKLPWQGRPKIGRTLLRDSWNALRATPRRWRLRRHEIRTQSHALVVDQAFGYALLLYYIDQPSQRRQLADSGFREIQVWDMRGRPIDETAVDPTSVWLHYACRA